VLLWRERRSQPPATRAFLDFVADYVNSG